MERKVKGKDNNGIKRGRYTVGKDLRTQAAAVGLYTVLYILIYKQNIFYCVCVRQTHWRQGVVCAPESLRQHCERCTGIFLRLPAAPCAPSGQLLW